MDRVRLIVAALLVLLSLVVDFSSRILSIGSDLLLVAIAAYLAWPYIKKVRAKKAKT